MAGRIWIPPYKPLDVGTQAVPGGGYIDVDASAGSFGPSPLLQLGLQTAEATVKAADMRMGEAEQKLLLDPQNGYLNTEGETALNHAPDVVEAYGQFQQREIAAVASDDQRRMLEELAQRRLTTFGEVVERHSAAERLRRALGTTRAEVRDRAERNGWEQALIETTLRQQTSRTLVPAIEAALERDPGHARFLRTGYDAHLEAPHRAAPDASDFPASHEVTHELLRLDFPTRLPDEISRLLAEGRLGFGCGRRRLIALKNNDALAIRVRHAVDAADNVSGSHGVAACRRLARLPTHRPAISDKNANSRRSKTVIELR